VTTLALVMTTGVLALGAGAHGLDLFHGFAPGDDLAEDRVARALGRGGGVIEKGVVHGIDEELAGGRIRVAGAGHGHGVGLVFQAAFRLVLDRLAGGLFAHIGIHPAALDHKSRDDAVEDQPVVVARFHVIQEIRHAFRGFVREERNGDVAHRGFKFHHDRLLGRGLAGQAKRQNANGRKQEKFGSGHETAPWGWGLAFALAMARTGASTARKASAVLFSAVSTNT